MAIDFPKNRTEAGIEPSGSLQRDDVWYSDGKYYTVVGFNDLGEAVWFGAASRRSEDPTLQDVLNADNTANDSCNNVHEFTLIKTDPNSKRTDVRPGSITLTDDTSEIGPRLVFENSSGDNNYSSRISVNGGDDSNGNAYQDRFILDTNNPEGVWVFDQIDDGNGNLQQREFRIRPSELEFARGVYSITDAELFGLPVLVEFGPGTDNPNDIDGNALTQNYTREDWSAVFNRALQNNPIGGQNALRNGPISTVTFPANTYNLLNPVVRTHAITIAGEGLGITKFWMEERINDVENAGNVVLWRMPPTSIKTDGSSHSGQFCLANKGNVIGVSFKGHAKKGGSDDTDNDDQYPDNDPDTIDDEDASDNWTYSNYSAVLAFRKYDNSGYAFDTVEHLNNVELDEFGVAGKQNDSADMDTKFMNCGFAAKGKGGERNGCIKYLGRNGYFSGCTFNSNYTGLVLSFPNRPGHDVATQRLGDNDITEEALCQLNNSVANEMQGGIYGWRRMQILGCVFHMNKKARCIQMFGKYQCVGMIIDGNQSDIGGKFLDFNSTGPTGGINGITEGVVYSNGVGGGLKDCIISNNSFGNQTAPNGAYITFHDGRFDGNVITGNSFYGNDDTFKNSVCEGNYTTVKRCAYAIKVNPHVDNSPVRDTVVRGLVISNNNFSYFTNNAIDVDSENVEGLVVVNNTFNNIGCPFIDSMDTNANQSPGRPNATAVKVEYNTTCIISGNMMIQETDGEPVDFGQNFFKRSISAGNSSTTNSPNSNQRLSNNTKLNLSPTKLPGTLD